MIGRRGAAVASVIVMLAISGCSSDGSDALPAAPEVTFVTPSDATVADTAPTGGTPPETAPSPAASPAASAPAVTAAPGSPGDPAVGLQVIAQVEQPVDVAWRTGDPTMFVVGQAGLVTPVRDGAAGDPVLDISDMTQADGERGLLGLTFSPDGSTAYIDHTDNDGDTVIASYAVGADGVFDPSSRLEMLTVDQPYANHNGGNVMIGPDGMLYIGMGDGGSGGDPERRALNVGTLLGKILRIDPTTTPYTVPADNPFVDVEGAMPEIWSVGVRNPWRMSFDPATGDLWFGDVGQGDIEEIDVAYAADGAGRGANFGWSAFEGSTRFNDDQSPDGATPPIYEYEHGDAGCSVSGGAMYRGAAIPALVGWFVFADYCSGNLYGILTQDGVLNQSLTLGNQPGITAVRAGPDTDLYVLSLDGSIARIVAA
jgi:glucose/arabinose dehydrogenase